MQLNNEQQLVESLKRLENCESLVEFYRGKSITKGQAKELYNLCKNGFFQRGSYSITEERLNDNTTLVGMRRRYFDNTDGEWNFFLVKGKLDNKLNMTDDDIPRKNR